MTSTEAPPTLRFEDAGECFICAEKFGVWTWRHHCRGCGRSCCEAHSLRRQPLPDRFPDDGPVRVCDRWPRCAVNTPLFGATGRKSAAAKLFGASGSSGPDLPTPPPGRPRGKSQPRAAGRRAGSGGQAGVIRTTTAGSALASAELDACGAPHPHPRLRRLPPPDGMQAGLCVQCHLVRSYRPLKCVWRRVGVVFSRRVRVPARPCVSSDRRSTGRPVPPW